MCRRRRPIIRCFGPVYVAVLAIGVLQARANTWDLDVGRLCRIQTRNGGVIDCGGGFDRNIHGGVLSVQADNVGFRSLMSELGVMFAPNLLSPAETVGWNGYKLGVELGLVTANTGRLGNEADQNFNLPFWRASENVSNGAFQNPVADRALISQQLPPTVAPTITVMARKGFWFPVPSFEIGFGARHLIGSRMWSALMTAKLAVHEGFQGLPLPAMALRGSASRVFGTTGFNLTVAGVDFSASKAFAIVDTFNITPYLGYQVLMTVADSDVLDATPNRDAVRETINDADQNNPGNVGALARCSNQVTDDCNSNFTFFDGSVIVRHRVFAGLRVNYYIASLVAQLSYFAPGSSSGRATLAGAPVAIIDDNAGGQVQFSMSLGVDY